jgi:hypothetical protein
MGEKGAAVAAAARTPHHPGKWSMFFARNA